MNGIFPENSIIEFDKSSERNMWAGYGKSPVFLFDTGEFKKVDGRIYIAEGVEVLKNWIEKVLRTERYRFPIYSPDYGVTLEELIAANLPKDIVENTLKVQITEALLQNPAVESVGRFEIKRENSCMKVSFEVVSVDFDTVKMEVGLNV